jgi:histone-lysine N-methyltransferase SUV39H
MSKVRPNANTLKMDDGRGFIVCDNSSDGVLVDSPRPSSRRSPSSQMSGRDSSMALTTSRSTSGDPMDFLSGSRDTGTSSVIELRTNRSGIEVLTWRDYRHRLLRARPPHRLAKDLPHTLEDHMNAMRPEFRRLIEMKKLFEAMISENTAQDEPNAPPIHVFNEYDSDPHPDWEFHYSNHMWYGEGVPGPNLDNLVGCDCEGNCAPKLRPCKCSERQRSFYSGIDTDFIYNPNKTLIYQNVPIHECNDLCSCDETCPNRVSDQPFRWVHFSLPLLSR